MKYKTHFVTGIKVLLVFALLFPSATAYAQSRLGGDVSTFLVRQAEIEEAKVAEEAAAEKSKKAEEELIAAILAKVKAGETLNEIEKEKHEILMKLEADKQAAEAEKKKKEEEEKAKRAIKDHEKEVMKTYDATEDKTAHVGKLSEGDKAIVDKVVKQREAKVKQKAIEASAIKKIEAQDYVFKDLDSKKLKEVMEKTAELTEDERGFLERYLSGLKIKEDKASEEKSKADKTAAEAEALYQETLKLLKEAETTLFGLKVEGKVRCNQVDEHLRRTVCKFKQSPADYAAEAALKFDPEECRYFQSATEPNDVYEPNVRCIARHMKIGACWAEAPEKQNACVKKALELPEKLVKVDEHCKGKDETCRVAYQNKIYEFVGYKFLVVAGQIEIWYFNDQLPIDVAAFRVNQVFNQDKAYYWAGDKDGKKENLDKLTKTWENTKQSLIDKIVEELKEDDSKILKSAQKKLEEGKSIEDFTEEEKTIYEQDREKRKALSVEKYKLNEENDEDGYKDLTEGERVLVDEAVAEQEAEAEKEVEEEGADVEASGEEATDKKEKESAG